MLDLTPCPSPEGEGRGLDVFVATGSPPSPVLPERESKKRRPTLQLSSLLRKLVLPAYGCRAMCLQALSPLLQELRHAGAWLHHDVYSKLFPLSFRRGAGVR